jgi:hypothetical protein
MSDGMILERLAAPEHACLTQRVILEEGAHADSAPRPLWLLEPALQRRQRRGGACDAEVGQDALWLKARRRRILEASGCSLFPAGHLSVFKRAG